MFGKDKIKKAIILYEQRLDSLKKESTIPPDPRVLNLEQFIQELKDALD